MKSFFGNVVCHHCELETRFFLEKEEEEILLLGDKLEEKEVVKGIVECDYCQSSVHVHVVAIDKVISAFLNEKNYENYLKENFVIEKAKENEGLLLEKEKSLTQFHETFSSTFKKHPLSLGDVFRVDGKVWIIKNIHRKENAEKDIEKRLLLETHDEYWYEVHLKNSEEKTKWIVVTDVLENNAILLQDPPVIKENEKVYDVSDSLFKTSLIVERELSQNFILKAYEMLSGVRVLVYSKDELEEENLEMDILSDNLEDALTEIEEVFQITD